MNQISCLNKHKEMYWKMKFKQKMRKPALKGDHRRNRQKRMKKMQISLNKMKEKEKKEKKILLNKIHNRNKKFKKKLKTKFILNKKKK